jgi:DNA polymerase-3 subunit delta
MADLNTTYLEGGHTDMAELHHSCDAIPFMADKRLVIVNGLLAHLVARKGQSLSPAQRELLDALVEYLPRLPDTTRLIFVESKPLPPGHPIVQLAEKNERGFAKKFDPPAAKAVPRWILTRARKHDGEFEPQAAHHLAAVVGTDLRLLDQEIAKLITYVNGERPVTKADVDEVVPYAQAAVIFDLVDALGRRDGRTATSTLRRLLDAGEHPMGILAMVVRQFRLLLQVKELLGTGTTPQETATALKIHPFPARKLHGQATHFTAAQLETVYRRLLDIDVAIKSGEVDAQVALDLLAASLTAD